MKIYFVGSYIEDCDAISLEEKSVRNIDKAFTSYAAAKDYVLKQIEHLKTLKNYVVHRTYECEQDYEWVTEFHFDWDKNQDEREYVYYIETIELEKGEDIPEEMILKIEAQNNALKKQNREIKKDYNKIRAAIAAAECYLTFYDAGVYADREELLTGCHTAKSILEEYNTYKGFSLIDKLFTGWLKRRENMK